ncbi:MAG: hypothetical protein IKM02_02680, partial [Clostridia bacterium]|nr:hypothetical protein [Clostridia bacterium]
PLLWLSENWLKLLILLILVGVGVDLLVWLIRWRPYWVWFRKERVIINDDRFFAGADLESDDDEWEDGILAANWDERNYVVSSKDVHRQNRPQPKRSTVVDARRSRSEKTDLRRPEPTRKSGAKRASSDGRRPGAKGPVRGANRPVRAAKKPSGKITDKKQYDDRLFGVDTDQPDAFDLYEDEVFNVSNLPISDEFSDDDRFS